MEYGTTGRWTKGILIALAISVCAGHSEADPNNEETIMDSIQTLSFLPFGIETEENVKQIEILLAFYSGKTGAGKQEITLKGDGTLKLPASVRRKP